MVYSSRLSDSESRVAVLVSEGYRNEVIAKLLNYSPKSIERMLGVIYTKLGIEPDPDRNPRIVLARYMVKRELQQQHPVERQRIQVSHRFGIVLGGKMYAGKSTVAKAICKYGMQPWIVRPMALRLKELLAEYHGITLQELESQKARYRSELQQLGTDAVRNHFRKDFWARLCTTNASNPWIIVDDVRFPDEVEAMMTACTAVFPIWIEAADYLREERSGVKFTGSETAHASEQSLTGDEPFWRFRIRNNGSLNWLTIQVRDVINTIESEVGKQWRL